MGLMHSALIKDSDRHKRIIRAFMMASHPLSGGDISKYVIKHMIETGIELDKALEETPQAISTTIGEMRSEENRLDGYIISNACYWKVAKDREIGSVTNSAGNVSYFLERASLPWHDGRPRYYLIAAPGWRPRWIINDKGLLVPAHEVRSVECGVRNEEIPSTHRGEGRGEGEVPLLCLNPACRKPIQRTPEDPLKNTCDETCFTAWRDSMRQKVGLF